MFSQLLEGEIPVESPWNPPGLPALPVARPPGRRDLARPAAEPPAGHGQRVCNAGNAGVAARDWGILRQKSGI